MGCPPQKPRGTRRELEAEQKAASAGSWFAPCRPEFVTAQTSLPFFPLALVLFASPLEVWLEVWLDPGGGVAGGLAGCISSHRPWVSPIGRGWTNPQNAPVGLVALSRKASPVPSGAKCNSSIHIALVYLTSWTTWIATSRSLNPFPSRRMISTLHICNLAQTLINDETRACSVFATVLGRVTNGP